LLTPDSGVIGELNLGQIKNVLVMIMSTILLIVMLASVPAQSQSGEPEAFSFSGSGWSVLLFGGKMSKNAFDRTLNPFSDSSRLKIFLAAASVSKNLYRGNYFDIEAEAGAGYQYSSSLPGNNSPQVWGSFYLRYKYFPWNKFIHTTIAINTGLNYSFRKTEFESREDGTSKLLHYLAPEITFSLPDRRDWELVFRLHHRSGIYGLLGCSKCGTNMISIGVRKHF